MVLPGTIVKWTYRTDKNLYVYSTGPHIVQGSVERPYLNYSGHLQYR